MEYKIKSKKYNSIFLVIVMIILLCSCFLIGTVSAWLTKVYVYTDNNTNIGSVHMEIYNNETKINQTNFDNAYLIPGNTEDRSVNLKIRNAGTIDAIVRVTMSLYYLDDNNNHVNFIITSSNTPSQGQVKLNYVSDSDWVTQFFSPTISCGYMYCNKKVEPYTVRKMENGSKTTTNITSRAVQLFSSIKVNTADKNRLIYISLTVDGVAYAGNIYKKSELASPTSADIPVTAYPFGAKEKLPSNWEVWK